MPNVNIKPALSTDLSANTVQCVSLANGTLSPDLRVNYEFGLVLGVNEFRQEQMYFLEKEYLHNRALHGYGTVYGLKVTTSRPDDNPNEVLVTLDPGMGIDQWGRVFILRTAQCARLGAWLAKQEQAHPGIIAENTDPSGNLNICIVASYDECSDALVPIPGQPCSSSEMTQAASRIRDSFNIEFRWKPPAMPAWDAVQRFARLMAEVRLVPNLSVAQSDEATIIAFVRTLDQPGVFDTSGGSGVMGSPPGYTYLHLPAETAHEALDRIFTAWVTEVRPRLKPDLSDPSAAVGGKTPESAVLLSCIDLTPVDPFDTKNPRIESFGAPDGTGRPFLLHTQLIQELLDLHSEDIGQQLGQQIEREFATLQVRNGHQVLAWIHHPVALHLAVNAAQALTVTADGSALTVSAFAAVSGFDNLFTISTSDLIPPGARVQVRFPLGSMLTPSNATLLSIFDSLGYVYIGRDGDGIVVYALADRQVRELATVRAESNTNLSLWLLSLPLNLTPPGALTVRRGITRDVMPVALTKVGGIGTLSSQWNLILGAVPQLTDGDLLEFEFNTDLAFVKPFITLTHTIQDQHIAFVGFDGDHTIRTFYEVTLPLQSVAPPTGPTLPLVTITPLITNMELANFEVWFHLNLEPRDNRVHVIPKELKLSVFAEMGDKDTNEGPLTLVSSPILNMRNVFNAAIDKRQWQKLVKAITALKQPAAYLRFAFPQSLTLSDANDNSNAFTLDDLVARTGIKFEGDNGKGFIVAYSRVPISQG